MSATLRIFLDRMFGLLALASAGSAATAHAQLPPDLMRPLDRTINSAIAKASQSRWERLPTAELVCIDKALQSTGSSLSLVIPNLQPTDPRLAEIRSRCRAANSSVPPVGSTSLPKPSAYAVDGLALGTKVNFQSSAYAQYNCKDGNRFPGFIWCQKTKHEPGPRRPVTVATSILHAQDGTAVYINRFLKPAFLREPDAQAEVMRLSAKYGPADVRRATDPPSTTNAVIATFGELTLKPLSEPELQLAAVGRLPHGRIPFDFFGDFRRSAQNGLPVFWIDGGSGFVWSASFDQDGRGHLRFAAADARSFTQPAPPIEQAPSDGKPDAGTTSPAPSNQVVRGVDNPRVASTQTGEPFYISPSVRLQSRTEIGSLASSEAICALLNHPLFSHVEVETGDWKSIADLDPDHSGKQWIIAHFPPQVREPHFIIEIDGETATKAEANLQACLQKLSATNAKAPAAIKRILLPNLKVDCVDAVPTETDVHADPSSTSAQRPSVRLPCSPSIQIDTTTTHKSAEGFLMLTMAEAQPMLKILFDRAEQALQMEIAAKRKELQRQKDQQEQDRLRREQIEQARLKHQQDQADQEAARQKAEQARLADLREIAQKKGIEYANKHETEWSISSKIDEMTDKTILTATSRQVDHGVVAEVTVKCSSSGLSITALIVDESGKATVSVPTGGSFLMPGAVAGQFRLNDDDPGPTGFFPASEFRNELNISGSLGAASLTDGIYWRLYASLPTDSGQLLIKVPLYAPQIQAVTKTCPGPH
ncbi:MAP7 domain-containing protein [Bradyrhizobium jicamae]|uniref:MAP7 domain-containing protein n=1 Tax=Bradyrhizobium jicamae TaxID=280332 RepID=UPI001BA7F8C3|nr:MAP7 domain-containing protein [Bradyrhizobium jicamae]MBR0939241.1 hypothetical protein [Bradyrhizobium jicamae]